MASDQESLRRTEAMLKITVDETTSRSGRSLRLILKGKLAGAAVDDLEKTWNRVSEKAGAAIRVDLSAVSFISQAGEEALLRLYTKGAELRLGNLLMRTWVAQMWRSAARPIVVLGLLFAGVGFGQQASLVERTTQLSAAELTVSGSAPALAFARYLVSIQQRNPFTESGPVGVEIEASLPGLAKEGSMSAVRQTGLPSAVNTAR
jgi:hypothetical protein